jgi:DNA-binding response OmpR family regulator
MSKKILVVEDDADVQRGLAVWLRGNGFKTACARDAVEAISVAKREQPDLIVLDIGLPAGDGFVVMARLKSIADLANIPVIIITARDTARTLPEARKAGARAFLRKPVDGDDLLYSIGRVLSGEPDPAP